MNDSAVSVNTCPRCRCEPPQGATFCPFCGAGLDAPAERPAAPSAPAAVPVRGMDPDGSEARERAEARGAVEAVISRTPRLAFGANRVELMSVARGFLGGGLHPYLGQAVDAAMSAKE